MKEEILMMTIVGAAMLPLGIGLGQAFAPDLVEDIVSINDTVELDDRTIIERRNNTWVGEIEDHITGRDVDMKCMYNVDDAGSEYLAGVAYFDAEGKQEKES